MDSWDEWEVIGPYPNQGPPGLLTPQLMSPDWEKRGLVSWIVPCLNPGVHPFHLSRNGPSHLGRVW